MVTIASGLTFMSIVRQSSWLVVQGGTGSDPGTPSRRRRGSAARSRCGVVIARRRLKEFLDGSGGCIDVYLCCNFSRSGRLINSPRFRQVGELHYEAFFVTSRYSCA